MAVAGARPLKSLSMWTPLVVCLALPVLYYPTTGWLLSEWWTIRGPYSHGFVALAAFLYLTWIYRQQIFSAQRSGVSALGCAGVFAASLLWLLAWSADIIRLQLVALVAMLALTVFCFCGARASYVFSRQLAVLALALPIWGMLIAPLQKLATLAVGQILAGLAMPAFIEGNVIHALGGAFEVAGGCSGLGYLLVGNTLVLVLLNLNNSGIRRMALGLLLASLLALASNWLRIAIIIHFANTYGMEHPLVHDHVSFGWLVFGCVFAPFLMLASRHTPRQAPRVEGSSEAPAGWGRYLAMLLTAVGAVWSLALSALPTAGAPVPVEFPDALADAPRHTAPSVLWEPAFSNADHRVMSGYLGPGGAEYLVFYADYFVQSQDHEVIHVENTLGGETHRLDETIAAQGQATTVALKPTRVGPPLTVKYTYLVGGKGYGNPVVAKLRQALRRLKGDARGAILALACVERPDSHCMLDEYWPALQRHTRAQWQ